MTDEYRCPICGKAGPPDPRYPRCICVECGHRATDENGRGLKFSNESVSGGFVAEYRDNGESRGSHVCFVDGIRCWSDEAHMGGIVVSLYDKANKNE